MRIAPHALRSVSLLPLSTFIDTTILSRHPLMYLSATRPTMAAGAWAVGFRSVRLPTELWGAVNAVRRAIAPLPPRTPKPTTHHTHRVAAGVGEPLIAPAEGPPLTFSGPRHDLVALLDTRPALTLLEVCPHESCTHWPIGFHSCGSIFMTITSCCEQTNNCQPQRPHPRPSCASW